MKIKFESGEVPKKSHFLYIRSTIHKGRDIRGDVRNRVVAGFSKMKKCLRSLM